MTKFMETCLFSVLRRKTKKWMQTNQFLRNTITLPKRYNSSVFELVTSKKRENRCKALPIGKEKDITRNVNNECFIVSQELQGKKRKNSCIWRSFLVTKTLVLMNNTLKRET